MKFGLLWQAARSSGGCVLVHCSQGVSRSAALSIGYLMWKLGRPYQEVRRYFEGMAHAMTPASASQGL